MGRVGLVLQGGGMRGIYTSGVLDLFLDQDLSFPYVIGVSAGSCNGAAFISRQRGLGKTMYTKYMSCRKYVSFSNLIKQGNYFNMDFIFNQIAKQSSIFDSRNFFAAEETFLAVATDCLTGKTAYFSKDDHKNIYDGIRASISLPFMSKMVQSHNRQLLDGGLSDPIPILKSLYDGNKKNVIVMTETTNYHRKMWFFPWLASIVYAPYKALYDCLRENHHIYNATLDLLYSLQLNNKIFIICPSQHIKVKRVERNTAKLNDIYELGYQDAARAYDSLVAWLNT